MTTALSVLFIFIGVSIAVWLVSFSMEALRPAPQAPRTLHWATNIPVESVEVGGDTLRYIKTGKGSNLVLLHTLRTQLDLFEKVVPELAKHFTVYAPDYPGHGYSDIPRARYDATFFTEAAEGFLDKLDLRDVTLAGVSIGGAIALNIAARHLRRVARVIAINPYDYAKGRGMARSSPFGWLVTYAALLPVVGETVMRLRNSHRRSSPRWRCRCEQHSADAHAGNVSGGESSGPLSRLPQSLAKCGKLGDGNQGLRPHRGSSPAHLGGPGLGEALRA